MGIICEFLPDIPARFSMRLSRDKIGDGERSCIWCGYRKPRPKQRTCQPCHSEYVQERRATTAQFPRNEYASLQLSFGG